MTSTWGQAPDVSTTPPAAGHASPPPPGTDTAPTASVPAANPDVPPQVNTVPPTSAGQPQAVSTLPPVSNVNNGTVMIDAGKQNYTGDIATADDNVILHYHGDVIFADHMIYDRSTHIVIAMGNARIFAGTKVYRGDSITYNLDTKAMTSTTYKAADYPRFLSGKQVTTPDPNHYHLTNAYFTTSNREHPSFHLAASTIEYRPNDEVVMKNVVAYVGNIPILYFPIIVQSLTDSRPTYQFEIGSSGQFGYFMDNKYNWVASDKMRGSVNIDLREDRGYAGGVDVQYFPSATSDMLLKTYYAKDNLYALPSQVPVTVPLRNPPPPPAPQTRTFNTPGPNNGDISNHNAYDGVPSDNRFRIAYQNYLQFGPDFSSTADINAWSDPWITRDYFQSEYQAENQPANFISLNQYNPNFTISLLAQPQVNPFFETVERLPELSVESKQQKIFGLPVEYTSQSSVVNFQRKFADLSNFENPNDYIYNSFSHEETAYDFYHPNPAYTFNTAQQNNYSAYRYDTYHEFSLPHQYFNFLTLTPRAGGRLTYYTDTNQDLNDFVDPNNNGSRSKVKDPKLRYAANIGLEGDFKISRTWTDIKFPNLGINGIRHEIEPFFDAEYAPEPNITPNQIRGFDNRLYSTQLQPLDWTEYNSIDSIDKEAVLRFGLWNKIQTKRDGVNFDLLTVKTYADADFDHNFSASSPAVPGTPARNPVTLPNGHIIPGSPGTPGVNAGTLSNVFNDVRFRESQQLTFQSLSAIAVEGKGYNEIDNNMIWSPDPSLQVVFGDHYLNHSPIFGDSNQLTLDVFYRINEHWQVRAQEQFEATNGHLQSQQYTVYRDLDAWQLAMSYSDSEINGQSDHTVYFSLTLKAFPKANIHTPRF